ncbi:MAG TPA: VWA domain-containing protein [Candidatus Eremiobacteraceae bacterium]|nr:VWA domain-containing protein [Candidatus Eremiobacteraceae bacterium]
MALLAGGAAPVLSQETTLHSQSNVVIIPALVKSAQGEIVYGLAANDFVVEDDGVEQTVRMDETAEGQPVSLVIAIQCGRRANYEFPRIRGLSAMLDPLVASGLGKVAIVEFDSQVQLTQDFTSAAERIAQTLKELQPGDGGAAILDALNYSVKLLETVPKQRQRVLLLISETRDHGSHAAKVEDVVAEIGQSRTAVYTLAFSPSRSNVLDTMRGDNIDEMHPSPDLLAPLIMAAQAMKKNTPKAVASMTGGEYELFATRKNFEARMIDFTNHLHARYLLSIAPKSPHPGLHQLRVRLRDADNKTVLARSSYWAGGTME